MGGKPRVDLQAGVAFDTIDMGPHQLRVDLLRKDGKPIPSLRIEGGSIKRMRSARRLNPSGEPLPPGDMRIDLRIGYDDPEW